MRIYRVNIEHKKWGIHYSSRTVAARTCEEAITKAKKDLSSGERVESVVLLAEAE